MKHVMFLVLSLAIFSGCNEDQILNQNAEIAALKAELNSCKQDNEVCNAGFIDAVNDRDSFQILMVQLEADKMNLLSEIEHLNDAHLVEISNLKNGFQDSIDILNGENEILLNSSIDLEQQLNDKTIAYNDLLTLHNIILENNYLVGRNTVNQTLSAVNVEIGVSEQAYHQLNSIEPQNDEIRAALYQVNKELNFNYGQRFLIGKLFEIQVENGQIND